MRHPAGGRANLPVSFRVAGQASVVGRNSIGPTTYSYRAPTVNSVFPSFGFLVAQGRTLVLSFVISGNDLGIRAVDIFGASVGGAPCLNVSVSADASLLTCSGVHAERWNQSMSAGSVVVNIGGQVVTSESAVDFIGPPVISSIDPAIGSAGTVLTVRIFSWGSTPWCFSITPSLPPPIPPPSSPAPIAIVVS